MAIVLYSVKDKLWKVADLGLTCEAVTSTSLFTDLGIPGYRAPELVQGDNESVTKKVDIWAMGCILFELLTGKKAFPDDAAVANYAAGGEQPTTNVVYKTALSKIAAETFSSIIDELLSTDPIERPSSHRMAKQFEHYRQLLKSNEPAPPIASVEMPSQPPPPIIEEAANRPPSPKGMPID